MRTPVLRPIVLIVVALGLSSAPVSFASAAATEAWTRPVPGPVVRAFSPPPTRYAAGHLGADLAARPGTAVRAAGAGTVEFAGLVAGTRHVVIRHPGGLRTSYSFLRTIPVSRGQRVLGGQLVGLTGGTGPNHAALVLHLGLREGDAYVDPMQLFAPVDLSERVRLAPLVAGASGPG